MCFTEHSLLLKLNPKAQFLPHVVDSDMQGELKALLGHRCKMLVVQLAEK